MNAGTCLQAAGATVSLAQMELVAQSCSNCVGGRRAGPAREKGSRHQALLSNSSSLKERKPLEVQHQDGKQPWPAQRLNTERRADVPACPVWDVHSDALLMCVVPPLLGHTLCGLHCDNKPEATALQWGCHPAACLSTHGTCRVR